MIKAKLTHLVVEDLVWAMGGCCALNREHFDAGLRAKQFPPPHTVDAVTHIARAPGFRIERRYCQASAVAKLNLLCLAVLPPISASQIASSVNSRLHCLYGYLVRLRFRAYASFLSGRVSPFGRGDQT